MESGLAGNWRAVVGSAQGADALAALILGQAAQRVVHLPRKPFDLAVELLEFDDWVVGSVDRRLSFGLEQGRAERGRRDWQRELAPVIFAAVPHHRGLDRADLRQFDLEASADQH